MNETLESNDLTVVGAVMPNQKHLPVELTKKQVLQLDLHYLLLKMILPGACGFQEKNELVLLLSTAH